jgi:hypothetical protein
MFDLKFIEQYLSVFNMLNHIQNVKRILVPHNQVNQILDKSVQKISSYYREDEDDFTNYQFDLLKYFDLHQSFQYYRSKLYNKTSNHVFM